MPLGCPGCGSLITNVHKSGCRFETEKEPMERICHQAQAYMEGLITKDEFLLFVSLDILKLTDAQAMAFAVIMRGEEGLYNEGKED